MGLPHAVRVAIVAVDVYSTKSHVEFAMMVTHMQLSTLLKRFQLAQTANAAVTIFPHLPTVRQCLRKIRNRPRKHSLS